VNHPDTDIADAIIAGIGGADNSTEQMAAVVTNLERAGFKIIPRLQYEALVAAAKELETIREEAATCGKMCCLYAEEADANGQKSMSGCIIDSVAPFLVSIAYPLREMCHHEGLDKQAGVCWQCGIREENIAALRAAGIQIEE
jgi:hypothetical protein